MKISSIKTCFHIFGAAISIVAVFCFLIVLVDSPGQTDKETVIALFLGLFLAGTAIYCFAGAPHLSRVIKKRFPKEDHSRPKPSYPRHGLKAAIGIGLGMLLLACFGLFILVGLSSGERNNSLGEFLFFSMAIAPILNTWGSIHLAWFCGVSPHIPLAVAILGGLVVFLVPLAGFLIMNVVTPLVVVILSPKNGQLRGRR